MRSAGIVIQVSRATSSAKTRSWPATTSLVRPIRVVEAGALSSMELLLSLGDGSWVGPGVGADPSVYESRRGSAWLTQTERFPRRRTHDDRDRVRADGRGRLC